MRRTEPNGTRKRVSFFLPKKMLLQNKKPSRERMTTCWRRLSAWKSRIRETLGSTKSQWTLEKWKLTISCSMASEVVFWTDLISVEQVRDSLSQMDQELPPARLSDMEPIDPAMELTKVWIISSLVSSLSLELIWVLVKIRGRLVYLTYLFLQQVTLVNRLELQLELSHSQVPLWTATVTWTTQWDKATCLTHHPPKEVTLMMNELLIHSMINED